MSVRQRIALETAIMHHLQVHCASTLLIQKAFSSIHPEFIDDALLSLRADGLVSCTNGVWWYRAQSVS